MAKLTTKQRNSLPDSAFGIPSKRAYPEENASHAKNAKARASQQVKTGHLSMAELVAIDRKADKKLGDSGAEKKMGKGKKC